MIHTKNATQSALSEDSAVEIIDFYSNYSHNIRFDSSKQQLIVTGLGTREDSLIRASLVALGAQRDAFISSDTDDKLLILSSARMIAQRLAERGISFSGQADITSGKDRA